MTDDFPMSHRITVGEELRYDTDLQTVRTLSTNYGRLWVTPSASTNLSGTLVAWTVIAVDCTAGAGAWNLPAASSVTAGIAFCAKKADTSSNPLVVSRAGSDLIFGTGSGTTSKSLTLAGEAVEFVSDGVSKWTIRTSDTPSGALSNAYAQGQPVMRAGRFVALGDSVTIKNSGALTAGLSMADSWVTHFALASSGAVLVRSNAGVGGNTSTQMLARYDTDVTAYSPTLVGICAGLNDTLDGSNQPTTTAANIKAMIVKARTAGQAVFLCTLPPQGMAALGTPAAPTATASTTGGTLAAATYSYRVAAVNSLGATLASTAATATVGSGTTGSVRIVAAHVEGATSYKLYGRTGGSELLIATNTATGQASVPNRLFTDTGSVTPSGAVPGSDTTAAALDSTAQLKIVTINAWLKRYAAFNGIPLVDFYSVLVAPSTGLYQTGYTYDGTHPTPAASRRMGSAAWTALSSWIVPTPSPTVKQNVSPINIWPNGLCLTGSGSLPTGWNSSAGTGSNFTDTLGTVTGFTGNGFTMALTDADTRNHGSTAIGGTPWTTGDKLLVAARVKTTGCEAGGLNANFRLREFAGNTTLCELYLSASDIDGVWTTEITAPATNNVAWQGNLSFGVGTLIVGELTIYNLTTGAFYTP